MAHVEQDVVGAGRPHLGHDGACDDVPRRQLAVARVPLHEPPLLGIEQDAALAAHCLRDEEGRRAGQAQGGGVELEELHVHDLGAGPESQGDAVAGDDAGVRGDAVEASRAASGEHEVAAGDPLPRAGREVEHVYAAHRAVFDHGVARQRELADGDAPASRRVEQRGFDVPAGRVAAGVQDAGHRVRSLPRQDDLALHRVEGDTEADEVGDAVGRVAGQDLDVGGVAEPRSRAAGVVGVPPRRVAGSDGRRDAALGVLRVAVLDAPLGEDEDARRLRAEEGRCRARRCRSRR